jgi:hypothetical protein
MCKTHSIVTFGENAVTHTVKTSLRIVSFSSLFNAMLRSYTERVVKERHKIVHIAFS